jgi:hypothetical protein
MYQSYLKFILVLLLNFYFYQNLFSISLKDSSLSGVYIQKIKEISGFTVWQVDGNYIRNNVEIEFTNFGHHLDFSFIPEKELWIDFEGSPDETNYYIEHMLCSYKLMSEGKDYDYALVKADSVERIMRLNSEKYQRLYGLRNIKISPKEILKRFHKKFIYKTGKGLNVWITDGELVRDVYFIDFTEGGHDKVYSFIPPNEVWIDDDIPPGEIDYIILHELHERYLMSGGMVYDEAHELSSSLELSCRKKQKDIKIELLKEKNKKH